MTNLAKSTGQAGPNWDHEQHRELPILIDIPGTRPTAEQLAETRQVWSRAYGRVLSDAEALEIWQSVRRLAEVLCNIQYETRHEHRHLGQSFIA
ncbi:MAG: hypothetical protein SFX18_15820 [Pirellulales bacterium]|nr:hypothetical protein [Pirellulales bacterium]